MREFTPLDGALLVDKPEGWTSHDVVAKVRNHFRIPKVGHCGTLDPMATGLLILVFGQATRLSESLMATDKIYEGVMRLGESTDSHDADGELTMSMPVPPLSLDDLNEAAKGFVGDLHQIPPMVSAVKIGGVPLHKLARKGQEVERQPRLVHIYSYKFHEYEEPFAYFEVACTKGTYIRVLADDLGKQLGCGAHLTRLRRLSSGRFDVEDANPLETILKWTQPELEQHVIPFLKLKTPE
jgi:tRNA pseudouridine55 synthase